MTRLWKEQVLIGVLQCQSVQCEVTVKDVATPLYLDGGNDVPRLDFYVIGCLYSSMKELLL